MKKYCIHGYIAGEEYICPECGEKTEVYSRITGYYRPVQNWNEGKAEEFKERKLYDISRSKLKSEGRTIIANSENVLAREGNPNDVVLLFTTRTCPNCKIAKEFLDKANIKYQAINAEENIKLVEKYGVQSAPTLVTVNSGNVQQYVNASNIKKYAENK